MPISKVFFFLLLLVTSNWDPVHPHPPQASGCTANSTTADGFELVPLIDQKKVDMMMVMNETRRKLGSFQVCSPCTCCGGPKGYCLPFPCCYAINCNIPGRPFGFCSFIPITCNCFGCHS